MKTIEATYRIVTPMFCAGADQRRAELRLSSFKGALRFWWRSLAWGRGRRDPKEVWKAEARLFGSTETGASPVVMRLGGAQDLRIVQKGQRLAATGGGVRGDQPVIGEGARYLGYGVMEAFANRRRGTEAGQLTRPCFEPGQQFTVELCLRPGGKLSNADLEDLVAALKLVGLVGGLGSKARKGYGSVTLTRLRVDGYDDGWKDLDPALAIRHLVRPIDEQEPAWTAWSARSRFVVVEPRSDSRLPLELLDQIGRELIRFRSWGKDGRILGGMESERNFKADHDLMKRPSGSRRAHPERIAFGLPHNYGKDSREQVEPAAEGMGRRGSPLFIHIHQRESDDQPVALIAFLPAAFLPPGRDSIRVGSETVPLARTNLWEPVHGFLDRLATGCKEPITGKEVTLG